MYVWLYIYICVCNTITIPPPPHPQPETDAWMCPREFITQFPVICQLAVKYHIGTKESNCLCVKYDERSLPVHKNQNIKYSPPCLPIITKSLQVNFFQNNIYVYNITSQYSNCILFINGQWPVNLEKIYCLWR